MPKDAEIEAVARAICKASGSDPDEICLPETPTWAAYIPEAAAAISALDEQRRETIMQKLADEAQRLGMGYESPGIAVDRERLAIWLKRHNSIG